MGRAWEENGVCVVASGKESVCAVEKEQENIIFGHMGEMGSPHMGKRGVGMFLLVDALPPLLMPLVLLLFQWRLVCPPLDGTDPPTRLR